jgi:hypothetical protein
LNSTTDLNTLSQNLTGGAGGAGSTQATPGAASILANAQAALASAQAAICGLPSVSAASTPTVVATTTPAAPQSLGAPAVMQAVNAITPGAGSFTDSAGNTYAIDPGSDNTATIDGQPITPNGESTNTSQMTMVSGVVYGQDATTNQWFEMFPGPGSDRPWAWEPLTNLPTAGESPTPTDRWVTAVSAQ